MGLGDSLRIRSHLNSDMAALAKKGSTPWRSPQGIPLPFVREWLREDVDEAAQVEPQRAIERIS